MLKHVGIPPIVSLKDKQVTESIYIMLERLTFIIKAMKDTRKQDNERTSWR